MRKPRIAIDGFNLTLEQGTGIATYARNLSYQLGALGADVGVLYGQRPAASADDDLLREVSLLDALPLKPHPLRRAASDLRHGVAMRFGVTATPVPITSRVVRRGLEARTPHADRAWNYPDLFRAAQLGLGRGPDFGRVTLPDGPDVMHWTFPLPVRVEGAKNIYTIHDLVPLRLPYATLDVKRRFLSTVRGIVHKADHIVTVSEASKRDIIDLLGVKEDRVTNTYQAVSIPDALAKKPEPVAAEEIKGVFDLDWKGYWLFFGGIEPKKNLGRLLEGYLASGSPYPLVIVGRRAWQSRQELALLHEDTAFELPEGGPPDGVQSLMRKLRDRVIMLEYAPFRLLVNLIRGARCVTFPSIYEGFGLPALEAMLLGTPVITSNVAALPEVVGDAAMTVDPYDTAAITAAIRAMDASAELRADYAERGPRRAALFSETAYRERLRGVYAQLGVQLDGGRAGASAPAG